MSHRSFDDPNSIAARQTLLDNRCEHATKRHRTRKRTRKIGHAKRQKIAHKLAVASAKRRAYLAQSRAYWAGENAEHPSHER